MIGDRYRMTVFEVTSVALIAFTAILIPTLALMIRIITKWTRSEDKLDGLVKDVAKIIEDKEKVHLAIYDMIREDRKANNERLRWLEETVWMNHGPSSRQGT